MEVLRRVREYVAKRMGEISQNLGNNNLWKRIVKNTVATTAAVSISLIPGASDVIGRAAYLGAMTTVFGHPGRRFGQLAEALILAVSGTLIGLAWSTFGLYLSSLIIEINPSAAYAIRGLFLTVALMVHGFLRSYAPRLFVSLVLLVIVSAVNMLSTAKQVTRTGVTQILYPILIAVGVILIVNLCIFPEFSSGFLGQTTIETLHDTASALEKAGYYFTHTSEHEGDGENKAGAKHAHHPCDTSKEGQTEPSTSCVPGISVVVNLACPNLATKSLRTGAESSSITSAIGKKSSQKATDGIAPSRISLGDLTSAKGTLRKKLSDCKSAQNECNFELAYAVLPPRDLKPISSRSMTKLLANVVAVISSCESKFALAGDLNRQTTTTASQNIQETQENGRKSEASSLDPTRLELELVKPKREIEFGDVRLLRYLLKRVSKPYDDLMILLNTTVAEISACIAYVYGVPKLPSGRKAPTTIILEDLDVTTSQLQQALRDFDADTASALESAVMMQELEGHEPDIMPREEVFLISSFLLNFRQAAAHVHDMLKSARELVDRRQKRHDIRRLYAPRIKWTSWLLTGGDDEALPASGRKANRQGASTTDMDEAEAEAEAEASDTTSVTNDEEKASPGQSRTVEEQHRPQIHHTQKPVLSEEGGSAKRSPILTIRGRLADALEWIQESDDFLYASKLTVAVILVSWPAWVPSWNAWYSLDRGLWAALQLIFVTEVSIGSSIWIFVVRGIGTTLGCIWGWASFEARSGNPIVCTAMICLGVIPSAYVQLGTKYTKAGMVSIISMCVVALSTKLETVPGTATENFLKRWIAFMIGGLVAVVVELVLLPVKARTRMVESLAAAIRRIYDMENCIAAGIEEGKNFDLHNTDRIIRFENASRKASTALAAAETFLPFCSNEPRIKGSFEGLALIYTEAEIYPYRRNVAGSITVTLFAIHGALLTKLPLPQFLPSARLAHLRMINRVREVVHRSIEQGHDQASTSRLVRQLAVRQKYMSWNAASAAQAEVIEFLEELVDLTKLLVGANEFRSGLLTRPTYHQYQEESEPNEPEPICTMDGEAPIDLESRDGFGEMPSAAGSALRRRATTRGSSEAGEEIPPSLMRIQSRKIEAGLRRQRTNDSSNKNAK